MSMTNFTFVAVMVINVSFEAVCFTFQLVEYLVYGVSCKQLPFNQFPTSYKLELHSIDQWHCSEQIYICDESVRIKKDKMQHLKN